MADIHHVDETAMNRCVNVRWHVFVWTSSLPVYLCFYVSAVQWNNIILCLHITFTVQVYSCTPQSHITLAEWALQLVQLTTSSVFRPETKVRKNYSKKKKIILLHLQWQQGTFDMQHPSVYEQGVEPWLGQWAIQQWFMRLHHSFIWWCVTRNEIRGLDSAWFCGYLQSESVDT